ncbi:MAG: hypothetical protein HUU45_14080, partial [Leptospiraceae bacterium]|nr:hypothetical protein [Leptospiraceae bacterium]
VVMLVDVAKNNLSERNPISEVKSYMKATNKVEIPRELIEKARVIISKVDEKIPSKIEAVEIALNFFNSNYKNSVAGKKAG